MNSNDFLGVPRVVNIKNDEYDVYIGRGTKWGSPYHIGVDGTRAEVMAKYESYARSNTCIMSSLLELRYKVLGCHCKPKKCHGEILAKLVKEEILKNERRN